jgi:hypothetical protein
MYLTVDDLLMKLDNPVKSNTLQEWRLVHSSCYSLDDIVQVIRTRLQKRGIELEVCRSGLFKRDRTLYFLI